ncbi:MAG: hypothetical protein HMLKMBBP_00398 [Planctomycetes bacterium]|nr:hypothetical protein [Planctomycetota bacterium]
MKSTANVPCLTLALACCGPVPPPGPPSAPEAPPPVQAPERKEYKGTRVGQVLVDLNILDDILISGPRTRVGPPGQGSVPIPVQDSAAIAVTLSNDTDRDIGLEGDWPYLFRVTVTNSSGMEIFEESQSSDALPRIAAGDVKRFEMTWPLRTWSQGKPVLPLPLGTYTVTLRMGGGGKLTTTTRLY